MGWQEALFPPEPGTTLVQPRWPSTPNAASHVSEPAERAATSYRQHVVLQQLRGTGAELALAHCLAMG
jgi:hypothetical protein